MARDFFSWSLRQELAIGGVPGTRAEEAYAIAFTCKASGRLKRHLILQW
jgi:hypothetical protein